MGPLGHWEGKVQPFAYVHFHLLTSLLRALMPEALAFIAWRDLVLHRALGGLYIFEFCRIWQVGSKGAEIGLEWIESKTSLNAFQLVP